MSDENPRRLPSLENDDDHAQQTRAVRRGSGTRRLDNPPPPPEPTVPPPPRRTAPAPRQARGAARAASHPPGTPRGKARARRDSGLYLPLWSIGLMLLTVCGLTVGIVLLVLSLGADNRQPVNALGTPLPPTQPPPVLIVSSPVPTQRPASFPASPATPTLPPQFDPAFNDGLLQAPADFSLAGPTLPPVEISPTPVPMGIGVGVLVVDVGDQQLNVRDEPGIFGTEVLFRAAEGERFRVIGGPVQQDNFTWWQIQDSANPQRTGWAASQYLRAVSVQ